MTRKDYAALTAAHTPLDLAQFEGHTAGPWTPMRDSDDLFGIVAYNGGDSFDVARVDAEDVNSQLICAAPALLSECKRQREQIQALQADRLALRDALELAEATICRLKPPVPYDSTHGTRDVIRAALAKVAP